MTTRTADSPYVCGWTMDDGCCSKLAAAFEAEETTVLAQQCVNQAAEILYALSGRQFGVCEVAVRPCRQFCDEGLSSSISGYRWTPLNLGGSWINVSCKSCKTDCSCGQVCEVVLPGPVDSITKIMLNGEEMDEDAYRVDWRRNLVRTDGDCWPLCQNMSADPATDDNTWEVTYGRGRALPVGGQAALGALACALCKACIGDKDCGLPERVTTIVRQGLTMALLDPMDFIDRGRTGIYAVDIWLNAVNPKARTRSAGIFSPDVEPPRVTTWP